MVKASPTTAALIACHIMWRELSAVMPCSPFKIMPIYFAQGLHDVPSKLSQQLQAKIDELDGQFDYILLGYGLCSNGLAGLTVKKSILVVPRAHDCITLLLGSKEKYQHMFSKYPGLYWFNFGWLETGSLPGTDWLINKRQRYLNDYQDEETADYLIEQEWRWIKEYQSIGLIEQTDLNLPSRFGQELEQAAQDAHQAFNWQIQRTTGSLSLLAELVNPGWDLEKFAVVLPGHRLEPSFDGQIFKVV